MKRIEIVKTVGLVSASGLVVGCDPSADTPSPAAGSPAAGAKAAETKTAGAQAKGVARSSHRVPIGNPFLSVCMLSAVAR